MNPGFRPRHNFIAAALIRRREQLLLVRQQGPGDERPYWALPGGRVETNEFLLQGLVREVREETGLTITEVGELAYTARLDNPIDGHQTTTRVFEIAGWQGELVPADPDQFVDRAAFFPLAEVVAHLRKIPWPVMREPVVAYVNGTAPVGTVWLYRQRGSEAEQLITNLTGPGALDGEERL